MSLNSGLRRNNQMINITELQEKISQIKEYLETEVCQRCRDMATLLSECEELLNEQRNRTDNN